MARRTKVDSTDRLSVVSKPSHRLGTQRDAAQPHQARPKRRYRDDKMPDVPWRMSVHCPLTPAVFFCLSYISPVSGLLCLCDDIVQSTMEGGIHTGAEKWWWWWIVTRDAHHQATIRRVKKLK